MVMRFEIGLVGTPSNGHNLEAANVAEDISLAVGSSPAIEAGAIGPVHARFNFQTA